MSPGSTALPTWENTQLVNGIKVKKNRFWKKKNQQELKRKFCF